MQKILIAHGCSAGQVEVTNDGATISKAVGVDMSRFQDDEVGDGTTSVDRDGVGVRVAARGGKVARANISPSNDYRRVACGQAGGTFGAVCHGDAQFGDSVPAKLFAKLAVDAVMRLKLDKKPVVHKPKRIDNIKILIANTSMDTDKIDGEDCRAGGHREGEDEGQGDNQDQARLGRCDLFEHVMIGKDTLLRLSGVSLGEAFTVVIRGATQQIIDEADRSLHDALRVLAAETSGERVIHMTIEVRCSDGRTWK
ncbi:chaperonin containing t-complex polypeptide 1 beta subunit [Culex quinquefasciatus]|uniref:Chaperonin containing t-complex polypeptide 1 beta subunit n=1 Tax=Culex quinquefasciatus TaxID=7176 RepID=B0X0K2_CULQU|nr:chaperonin containing t-complex polypeptide 1 beta subunit [Culex quinquefasciatus]|eukprot:XP_001863174.1 chaperonin containing t-complex polypeptide 1 beta subunit [Culex quinquefasciatus]